MHDIKIGTLVGGGEALTLIPKIIDLGFESFSITFWQTTGDTNIPELAKRVREITDERGIVISSVGIFGNPISGQGDNADTRASWERLIDNAHLFGTDIVGGFTGRVVGRPVDESFKPFGEVFGELARRAADKGVRIAFENCNMDGTWQSGDWNIAFNEASWEVMFNEVPFDNLGLEWEPCHHMVQLVDPIPQLRKWVDKIFHIHGKDATIAWDIIKKYGVYGPKQWAWHRTPGFGDSNWADIITILRQNNYKGTIDIEGYHDPVYRGELEWTGQVCGLNYLKRCRGGDFITI